MPLRNVISALIAPCLLAGCSTAPLADFLDYARPARSPSYAEPIPRVAHPPPAAIPAPIPPNPPASPGAFPSVPTSPPPAVAPPPL
ncbi:hypothetical protein HRbin36_02181 [bacterium HR36]|nr:hypothetical protein HRbin36_02181 [bacterium HR36]